MPAIRLLRGTWPVPRWVDLALACSAVAVLAAAAAHATAKVWRLRAQSVEPGEGTAAVPPPASPNPPLPVRLFGIAPPPTAEDAKAVADSVSQLGLRVIGLAYASGAGRSVAVMSSATGRVIAGGVGTELAAGVRIGKIGPDAVVIETAGGAQTSLPYAVARAIPRSDRAAGHPETASPAPVVSAPPMPDQRPPVEQARALREQVYGRTPR